MKARAIGAAVVALSLLAVAGYRLWPRHSDGVPLTAQGVPFLFGGPWLRPDASDGPAMDSSHAASVQAVALEALPVLVEADAGDVDRRVRYCVGTLSDYRISDLPATVLATLRGRDGRFVGAGACRFHVETVDVTLPGIRSRPAWFLWATVPVESVAGQAALDIGYHAGSTQVTVWRCFLRYRDGHWLVDSTARRWKS
jgi:hypothetical protein